MKKIIDEVENLGFKEIKSNLKENYNVALRDSKFKNLVKEINLSNNILMKYTSSLEESSIEYDNCRNCKSIYECKNKVVGYAYLPRVSNDQIIFEYKPCKFKVDHFENTKHFNNIYLFNAPKSVLNADIKDLYNKAERLPIIKWMGLFYKNYNKESKGLYLYGNFGVGKTYLISAIFNELAKQNIKSAIIYYPEFLRDLKSSFDTDFKEKFEKIKKVELLLIDDIGAENMTSWGRDEILTPILQYRMDQKLPTFFTSNLTLEQLEEHLSDSKDKIDIVKAKRIISRIEALTEKIELLSENFRQ
ncbi:MAG TPA: primosomal protein DnaI [Tenericutes bacterium]|nr:primosomal protein DnaI [Mycoplasmatota bacterium]